MLSSLPLSVKLNPALRYLEGRFLVGAIPDEERTLVLYTQYKAGSYYFRFLMANYLFVHFLGRESPVEYHDLDRCFPNRLETYRERLGPSGAPHEVIRRTPYTDFVFGHDQRGVEFLRARIVTLYRNPFDYIVSNFHYRYKNRRSVNTGGMTPADIVDLELPYLVKTYTLLERLRRKPNVFAIAYESLVSEPERVFAQALDWLEIPCDGGAVRKAVAFSSLDVLRAYEEKHGPIVVNQQNFTAPFFARSGKIGEWRDALDEEAVARLADGLAQYGIDCGGFITEPPAAAAADGRRKEAFGR